MKPEPVSVYAHLNARAVPLDRGERYEDPLGDALTRAGFGEVTGGGTGQAASGEIMYCGVDVTLFDVPKGVPFVCEVLTRCGAPRGSKLEYEQNGQKVEVPFGIYEGLALYLNGIALPDEVYRTCDVNDLYQELTRLLGDHGSIQGYWEGPIETALYLYGESVAEMRDRIAAHVAAYPLCQKSRLVQIA